MKEFQPLVAFLLEKQFHVQVHLLHNRSKADLPLNLLALSQWAKTLFESRFVGEFMCVFVCVYFDAYCTLMFFIQGALVKSLTGKEEEYVHELKQLQLL